MEGKDPSAVVRGEVVEERRARNRRLGKRGGREIAETSPPWVPRYVFRILRSLFRRLIARILFRESQRIQCGSVVEPSRASPSPGYATPRRRSGRADLERTDRGARGRSGEAPGGAKGDRGRDQQIIGWSPWSFSRRGTPRPSTSL
jgi:hypothetical protein